MSHVGPVLTMLKLALVASAATSVLRSEADPVGGQSTTTTAASEPEFAHRLALTRARHELLEQCYRLPVEAYRTVAHWAAGNPARDRALRRFVQSLTPCEPAVFFRGGTCDVVLVLAPQKLAALVCQLDRQYPAAGGTASLPEADVIASGWPLLWATGSAAAEEEAASSGLPSWEDVRRDAVDTIREAAIADARSRLLEVISDLPVTRARKVREFLAADPAIRKAVLSALEQSAATEVTLEPGWLAVAAARIDTVRLIQILTAICRDHYRGDLFQPDDFGQMALLLPTGQVAAAGVAFPARNMLLGPPSQPCTDPAPGWAETLLTARGRCVADQARQLGLEGASNTARQAALEHLQEQINGLLLPDGAIVGSILAERPELQTEVMRFVESACPIGDPATTEDGAIELTVGLPARRLWLIVCQALRPSRLQMPGGSTPGDQP